MRAAFGATGAALALVAAQPSDASSLAALDAQNADPAMVEGAEAWKYAIVDPQKVADDAYENYKIGHCMHTTFTAIVLNVAEALEKKDPLAARRMASFPFHMMHYGASGANGFGSLCGSLNGAMAAISLFVSDSKTRKALINEIGRFYERAMLPTYLPKDAQEQDFPQSIANSLLCHVSSGKWCAIAKVRTDSHERSERCTRLSADVARKTAELLNVNFAALNSSDVKLVVEYAATEPTATCVSCHDKSGKNADVIGTSTCSECHPDITVDHHDSTAK